MPAVHHLLRLLLLLGLAVGVAPLRADSGFRSGADQFAAGGNVQPDKPVSGDYYAMGGQISVAQPVAGSALLLGGQVAVRAPIGENLRIAGGNVDIDSAVAGNLMAAAGRLSLGPNARIGGDADLSGGMLTIEGRVHGKLVARAQHIVLDGQVDGDAQLLAQRIELGPNAHIAGVLEQSSRSFSMADSASVGSIAGDEGAATSETRVWVWQRDFSVAAWVGTVLGLLGLLVAGAVYLLLFPRFAAAAPRQIRRSPLVALLAGLAVLVGVPLLGVLLCITLLGLPLGLALFALYPLLLLIGYLTGALFVGQALRPAWRAAGAPGFGASALMLLLALLLLLALSRLPLIGHLVWLLVLLAGSGACVLQWRRGDAAP